MIDINTLTENINLLISLGEINVIFVGLIAYLVTAYTDIYKLFFPEKKKWVIPFSWGLAMLFSILLILGGTVGITILALLIISSVVVKHAAGDHSQKKAIENLTADYIPGQLEAELPKED